MQHKSTEIEAAANALGNQLAAGIKLKEAVGRMAKLQPAHAELWQASAEVLSRGGRLSAQLESVWPESVVAAIKAGEESDSLKDVFKRTAESMRVKAQVVKIYGKLVSPLVAFLAGLAVFLFFMVVVIPKLQASLGGNDKSTLFQLAIAMNALVVSYWPLLAGGLAGALLGGVQWFKKPETKDLLVSLGDRVPKLGEALRYLYFGSWAHQMALLDAAGLPVKQQLYLSAKTLPTCYQEGVLLMASEVEKRGIADSADPDKQSEGDPRKLWPFYVSTAFVVAHETRRIHDEMQRCAPLLIDDGIRRLTQFIAVADIVAKAAAAGMISLPLTAYFTQLSSSLTKAFG